MCQMLHYTEISLFQLCQFYKLNAYIVSDFSSVQVVYHTHDTDA